MPGVGAARSLAAEDLDGTPTFAEALREFGGQVGADGAIGFAYTPSAAPWFRWAGADAWVTREGNPIPGAAFELTAFTETAQLRWRRTSGMDRGRAVIITESDHGDGPHRLTATRCLMLWGAASGNGRDGWTQLSNNRGGNPLWVPLPAAKGAEVFLEVAEYAARDQYRNTGVVEQRLLRLTTKPDLATDRK